MSSNADQRPKAAGIAVELTDDAFIGGKVQLWQPRNGFRSGLDAVMLAACVPAKPREHICDLGAGAGAASLCLAARVSSIHLTGVEIDPGLSQIMRLNFGRNAFAASFETLTADILAKPRSLPRQHFHHVMTNPPFHDATSGTAAPDKSVARAKSITDEDLAAWLRFARALIRPKGALTAILPPAKLPLALAVLAPGGQGSEIMPLWPATGEAAKRVIIRVRTNSGTPLRLRPGLVLHQADGKPTAAAEAILRSGDALLT